MAGYYLSSSYGYVNQIMGRKIEEALGAFLRSSNKYRIAPFTQLDMTQINAGQPETGSVRALG